MNDLAIQPVTASLVPEESRLDFLPEFFGERLMQQGENLIYDAMDGLCEQYKGACWHFYKLSNGGFYMAPRIEGEMTIEVVGNYFSGSMSADAAGIVATLFGLNRLVDLGAGAWVESEVLTDRYYYLRDFACYHNEAGSIMRAID